MTIADQLYRLMPEKAFIRLRQYYHSLKKQVYSPMKTDEFREVLDMLGIGEGDVVFVHSSFDKMYCDFSAKEMLDILLEKVTDEGTLLFPSWNYTGRTEYYLSENKTFDVKKTVTKMGLLPELARRKKTAHRSLHPTGSVAGIGKHAEWLLEAHHLSPYACGEKSPYYKMMSLKGKIVGLGERVVSMSFIHCVEDVMGYKFPDAIYYPETFYATVRVESGKEQSIPVYVHAPNQNMNISGYFNKHISGKACRQVSHKGRNYFVADSNELFREMSNLARKGTTIYKN